MNAVRQPNPQFTPPQSPKSSRAVQPRPKRHLRKRSHQIMAVETTVKIGVNVAICAAAVSALTHMLPYNWSQQEKLRALLTQIELVKARVNNIETDFQRNFDPRQTREVMQKHGYRFDPSQRPVFITNDRNGDTDTPTNTP